MHCVCYASTFNGTLLCKETGKPVEYANIGIVGKNVGTTTDASGRFTIALDEANDNEQIRISSIGFATLDMKVAAFRTAYQATGTIYLSQQNTQLKEVVFKPKKFKHKRLGVSANSAGIVIGFDTTMKGNEAGVLMKIRKTPTFIDSVEINVCLCEYDSIFFRLNIYEHKDSDFVNVLREPVYINMPASAIRNHHISVDLSKMNVTVSNDFLVSVEYVRSLEGKHKMFFCGSLLSGKCYARKTSQADWYKVPAAAPGISAYVTY